MKFRTIFIGMCLGAFGLATQADAGAVEYPALGNFRHAEGTIEVWLTPVIELRPELEPGEFSGAFGVFSLEVPDAFRMSCNWSSKRSSTGHQASQHGIGVNLTNYEGPSGGLINLTMQDVPTWHAGQPGHVALVWRGKKMALYVDGQLISTRDQVIGFSGRLGDQQIVVGRTRGRANPVILHAVRISSITREPKALAESQPEADTATLLLDLFDTSDAVNEHGRTRPVVHNDFDNEGGGRIVGAYHWASAPEPGLALFPADID